MTKINDQYVAAGREDIPIVTSEALLRACCVKTLCWAPREKGRSWV